MTTAERMTELIESFPTLATAGLSPWSCPRTLLWALSGAGGSGAKHAARFCLSVWNPSTDWPDFLRELAAGPAPRDPEDRAVWDGLQALRAELAQELRAQARERAREEGNLHWRMVEGPQGAGAEVTALLFRCCDAAGPFVLHDALGVWDEAHRAAFLAWCCDPFWP